MRQTIHCQRCLSKGSLSKLQMAGLLQEAAGPLAARSQEVPMAKSVCGNSRPPQEFYAEIISAVQARFLLFSTPEPVSQAHCSITYPLHLFSVRGHMGVLCALNRF